jgi:hypothetical protein
MKIRLRFACSWGHRLLILLYMAETENVLVLVNWRLGRSQDQEKTIRRCLITSKVTLTGQSHFMLIFVLRKVALPNRINSVPRMNAVTLTPYHECTQLVQNVLGSKDLLVKLKVT